MTYAGYLAVFLCIPLLAVAVLAWRKASRRSRRWRCLAWFALAVHVVVAVVYTTPWDNYLVATGVWWYDPGRVTGVTLWWVPLEEYCFFVLQTLLTGLWLIWLSAKDDAPSPLRGEASGGQPLVGWRWQPWRAGLAAAAVLSLIWLVAVAILGAGSKTGAYLALELAWFLPPIVLQLAVGANILWQLRRVVLLAIAPPVLYLSITDSLAIAAGVWTISGQQTTGLRLGGVLPLEELVFFALTNTLIVFGMVLMLVIGSALPGNNDRQIHTS